MVFEKRMLILSTFYSNVTLSFRKALSNIEKKGINCEGRRCIVCLQSKQNKNVDTQSYECRNCNVRYASLFFIHVYVNLKIHNSLNMYFLLALKSSLMSYTVDFH